MKKYIIAAVAALGIAVPVVAPAAASANAGGVARYLNVHWGKFVRQEAGFQGGYRIVATTVKCADTGGGYYTCYGTYTAVTRRGVHAKYGTTITVSGNQWRSTNGTLIRAW